MTPFLHFAQLSKEPVKMGDVYDAGFIAVPMEKLGVLKLDAKYKIKYVSSDMKKAVLQPLGFFSVDNLSDDVKAMDVTAKTFNGWILFDLEKGMIVKSALENENNMSITTKDNQQIDMNLITKFTFKTE